MTGTSFDLAFVDFVIDVVTTLFSQALLFQNTGDWPGSLPGDVGGEEFANMLEPCPTSMATESRFPCMTSSSLGVCRFKKSDV